MRSALLRVLTDLYVQKPKHTADEERHYTELALRLIESEGGRGAFLNADIGVTAGKSGDAVLRNIRHRIHGGAP